MTFIYELIVLLHLVGMAGVVGGYLANIREPKLGPLMVHGALTQVVTGLILVGMRESMDLGMDPVNHAKIGVKLLVALVVAVLAFMNRKKADVPAKTIHVIGGLALFNTAIAALW